MKSKMEIVIDENNTNIKTYIDLITKLNEKRRVYIN